MNNFEYYTLFFMIIGVAIFLYCCISSLIKDVGKRFNELEERITALESKVFNELEERVEKLEKRGERRT